MIGPTDARAITIHVSETVFARLIDKARLEAKTPALYAKLLFEAAWAARCGKAGNDPVLVDCVEKSFRRSPPATVVPMRSASPVALPPVVRWAPVPVFIPVAVPIPVDQPVQAETVQVLAEVPEDPAAIDPAALVRQVRSLKAAGNTPKEIAATLGVDLMLVRGVLAGKVP